MNNKGLKITAAALLVVIICLITYNALWADNVAYKNVVKQNTIKGYKEFLSRYPNSEFANDIQSRYDEADYNEAVRKNSEDAFSQYLKDHPNSIYIDSAKIFIEEFAYEKAIASTDLSIYRKFIYDYPNSSHILTIQKQIYKMEADYYKTYVNISTKNLSRDKLQEYDKLFPNGRYSSQVAAKINDLNDYEAFLSAQNSNTKYSWQQYLTNYPKGKYASKAHSKIKEFEEREYYLNNSLANGSQPYASIYGYNMSDNYGSAMVRVKASIYSDVIVIVRYNNSQGKVAGHAYIQKGRSYTIYLTPEQRYQVFFYYGIGWYPKKEMSGGVKGGFLTNESFDKDARSHYFGWGEGIEYTLIEQIGGNFSTSKSSENEIF